MRLAVCDFIFQMTGIAQGGSGQTHFAKHVQGARYCRPVDGARQGLYVLIHFVCCGVDACVTKGIQNQLPLWRHSVSVLPDQDGNIARVVAHHISVLELFTIANSCICTHAKYQTLSHKMPDTS